MPGETAKVILLAQRAPQAAPEPIDVLWGGAAIARAIGKSERATFHLLERGALPARKIGGQWVALRSRLAQAFGGEP